MRRIFALALILILLISVSLVNASAIDYGCTIDPVSTNVYMENLDTNTVVYEKNADQTVPPASLTKIMTYIVVVENVSDLENTMVTITEDMFTSVDLSESSIMGDGLNNYIGEQFSVLELLNGLMIPSGNDAACALAYYIGDGAIDNFVDMMNRKAGQLACEGTHFINPHGLCYETEDKLHYTTARDMAIMLKYASQKPYFMEITGRYQYDVGMNAMLETSNYTIDPNYPQYYYAPIEGGKTGFTDQAGRCLATTASKDSSRYLCIAMGAEYSYEENVNYAMLDSKDLYEWAFNNIAMVQVLPTTQVVDNLSVKYVWGDKRVDIVPQQPVQALLPVDYDESKVTTSVDHKGYTEAPLTKGQVLGTISVYYDGQMVGTTNLVCNEDVSADVTNKIAHFFFDNFLVTVVICAIIITIVVYTVSTRKRKKKRQARHRYR